MSNARGRWAIVLAAGEGTRLRSLTTDDTGVAVPKQFCSLRGGSSLLTETIHRAGAVVDSSHVCVVVSAAHTRWWRPILAGMPQRNVIVQPSNRGTGNGILLPLLHIMERDPTADVLILPSDHHVRDELSLTTSLRLAMRKIEVMPDEVLLLGIHPEEADSELGYILPGRQLGPDIASVARFVEKPPAVTARMLVEQGAVWNSLIIAARATALLALTSERYRDIVLGMSAAIVQDMCALTQNAAISQFYRELRNVDFSSQILEGTEARLRLVSARRCGWSDLGTPRRVAETLRHLPPERLLDSSPAHLPTINLSVQHARAENAMSS
jgi:mannose-1-phosphate guanylyltransferase